MTKRTDLALEKLSDGYDGIENFHAEWEARTLESTNAWNLDHLTIGRVLRSHLYLEYYVNKYLKVKYSFSAKQLLSLSFFEKLGVIKKKDDELRPLIPSIKRLNHIRNIMSHNLNSALSEKDSKYFKTREFFQSYYSLSKFGIDESNPIEVYELYSQFIVHRIGEILNSKQELLDNVMKALSKDVADIYFENV